MNPEREILNFWYNRQGYLTTNNIKAGRNKEIYLVAVKLENGRAIECIHVEAQVSVSISSITQERSEANSIVKKKFEDSNVRTAMKKILNSYGVNNYQKVVVLGAMAGSKKKAIQKSLKESGVSTIDFAQILSDSVNTLDGQIYQNHTVRTLQLMKFLLLSSPKDSAGLVHQVMNPAAREKFIQLLLEKNPRMLTKKELVPLLEEAFKKSSLKSPSKLATFLSEGMTTKSYNKLLQELKEKHYTPTLRKRKEKSLRSYLG